MSAPYKRNFIKQVIFRIDFDKITLQDKHIKEFSKLIKSLFPSSPDCREIFTQELTASSKGVENGQLTKCNVWIYKNDYRTLEIQEDHIAMLYDKYKHFEPFSDDAKVVLMALKKIFPSIENVKRVGLRYLNEISLREGNPLIWTGYLNPSLLSSLVVDSDDSPHLIRSLTRNSYRFEDDNMTITFGIPNKDFPATISRKEFLLDLDCFISSVLDIDNIEKKLIDFNNRLSDKFKKSIGNKLKLLMNK